MLDVTYSVLSTSKQMACSTNAVCEGSAAQRGSAPFTWTMWLAGHLCCAPDVQNLLRCHQVGRCRKQRLLEAPKYGRMAAQASGLTCSTCSLCIRTSHGLSAALPVRSHRCLACSPVQQLWEVGGSLVLARRSDCATLANMHDLSLDQQLHPLAGQGLVKAILPLNG